MTPAQQETAVGFVRAVRLWSHAKKSKRRQVLVLAFPQIWFFARRRVTRPTKNDD
jgi:hypothetical protein